MQTGVCPVNFFNSQHYLECMKILVLFAVILQAHEGQTSPAHDGWPERQVQVESGSAPSRDESE